MAHPATTDVIPGLSQREISAESGRTYFFLARLSERSKTLNAMTAAAGLSGLVVAAAVTSGNTIRAPRLLSHERSRHATHDG
jgi:hypothetical protein